jgi:hypothetical protein
MVGNAAVDNHIADLHVRRNRLTVVILFQDINSEVHSDQFKRPKKAVAGISEMCESLITLVT